MHRNPYLSVWFLSGFLLLPACTQIKENQTATLAPAATATYKNHEIGDELYCHSKQEELPPMVDDADLAENEVGADFRNWMRRKDECIQNNMFAVQGLVRFDVQELPLLMKSLCKVLN